MIKILISISIIIVLLSSCNNDTNNKMANDTIYNKYDSSKNDTCNIAKIENTIEFEQLIADTTSVISKKFEKIIGEYFIQRELIEIEYIPDSLFQELYNQFSNRNKLKIIDKYSSLLQLIKEGKINLNINSICFKKVTDSIEYYLLQFKNGEEDKLEYNPKDWGSIDFMGYLVDLDYFWFQESSHGPHDFVINIKNGERAYFVPVPSPDTSYYFYLNTDNCYGDCQKLEIIIGKDINKPIIKINNEYYPLLKNVYARFGIEDAFWITDNQFAFKFYHIWENTESIRDTFFYKFIDVRIKLNAP